MAWLRGLEERHVRPLIRVRELQPVRRRRGRRVLGGEGVRAAWVLRRHDTSPRGRRAADLLDRETVFFCFLLPFSRGFSMRLEARYARTTESVQPHFMHFETLRESIRPFAH